ncbi:MAG: murein biosynthesis integral membrane protein MurJ [Pseudomonadota bacterium]
MKLLKATGIVSLMTLLSRVLGFVRDVVLARSFGASAATDAFYVALKVPNLLRRMFAEGAFSLAFVPVFSEYRAQRTPEELKGLLDAVAGALAAVLLVIVAVGMFAAPVLVAVFAPGFIGEADQFALATDMLRITFPYALAICLTALAGGVLNSFGRFAVPAFTPVLLNVALITAALALAPRMAEPIKALAWGVLAAGIIQLAFQIPSLMRLGLLPRPGWNWHHEGVVRIRKLMLPALFGSSVAQLNIMLDTLIASLISVGSITWLYYSDRLLEFPLGLFGIALSTVILPTLSRLHARTESQGFAEALDWGLRLGLMIALPAALGLILLAQPLVATLFNYGSFADTDVINTAASVIAYGAGLPAFVAIKVLAPAFYSRQDTRTPVRVAVIAMVSNMVLNVLFVVLLMRYPVAPPHAGLAAASSLSGYLNASLLYRQLRREGVIVHNARWLRSSLFVALGCLAILAIVLTLAPAAEQWLEASLLERVRWLSLCVITAAAAYGLLALIMRIPVRPSQAWQESD